MHFVSFSFLFLFLAVLAYRLTLGRRKTETHYLVLLLVASLVFYAWHIPAYLSIILTSTVVDYVAGLLLERKALPLARRRLILTVSLCVDLGLLFFFKYTDFFLEEVQKLLSVLGFETSFTPLGLILPMGISFYTFQSMSYTIDVYRGVIPSYRSFWKFLLFVSFFPQLMAGPIVRAKEFLYQIDRRRRVNAPALFEGIYLVVRGFFLKMVCADNIGFVVKQNWEAAAEPGAGCWLGLGVAFLFGFQIFCDFAGYSSIARGLAYTLGFRLPVNFNAPYLACSFREFWARWHMSLGRWLRDYLYVSLGGNRVPRVRAYVNLFLVMFLGGLWHGAEETIALFGTFHGLGLAIERMLGFHDPKSRLAKLFWYCVAQFGVMILWIFFVADGTDQMWAIVGNALSFSPGSLGTFPVGTLLLLMTPTLLIHGRRFLFEHYGVPEPGRLEQALLASFMLYAVVTGFGVNNAFIYFQF